MKQTISLLISLVIILNFIPANAEESYNLLQYHMYDSYGVAMSLSDGSISKSDRFNEKGALAGITDGNKVVFTDVYGALDWEYPKYIGVVLQLDALYSCEEIVLFSGTSEYPETHRVYASDSLSTLYSEKNIIADGIECTGETVIKAPGDYRYFAFFCTDYTICQRITEIEIYGRQSNPETIPALSVSENRIVDQNGKTTVLKGVNITELSWSVYGDGDTSYGKSDADCSLETALSWNCNTIRLAVNPEFYLNGGTSKGVTRTAEQYRELVDKFVTHITHQGIAVILDCHAYYGVTKTVTDFWRFASGAYDSNELVLYGLLNEPVSDWTTYYEGGITSITENGDVKNYTVTGIPELLDTVRMYSDNIAVIGGIDFAFDLSGISASGFEKLAVKRSQQLGITLEEYRDRYSLGNESRRGRGIVLDSHVYSTKPHNWDSYLLDTINEYPILLGEFGPTYSSGIISELSPQEMAYMQRIFRYIERYNLSFTAWGMNAWPFLTVNRYDVTAFGKAVRDYLMDGVIPDNIPENLLNTQFKACRPIASDIGSTYVYAHNAFYDQASGNGSNIARLLTDGDTKKLYDIYEWFGHRIGIEYELYETFVGCRITLSSGTEDYPDKYIIYASDCLETLYSPESIVENLENDFSGSLSFEVDRPVKYTAILADGYVRIKELELYGSNPGDCNADSHINSLDLALLKRILLQQTAVSYYSLADVNCDGISDIRDLINLKKKLA